MHLPSCLLPKLLTILVYSKPMIIDFVPSIASPIADSLK